MYAIIKIQGMQFKVEKDETILAPFDSSKNPGDKITINEVLLVADGNNIKIGKPYVSDSKVEAEIIEQTKGKKIIAFKKKKRTGYHLKKGARAKYTVLKILDIIQ